MGDFRLMGVDRATAEREENLIHLQLGGNTICRSAGMRADVQRTPEMVICTGQPTQQPNLMDLLCQFNREFCQRPGQAGLGQRL